MLKSVDPTVYQGKFWGTVTNKKNTQNNKKNYSNQPLCSTMGFSEGRSNSTSNPSSNQSDYSKSPAQKEEELGVEIISPYACWLFREVE